MARDHVIVAGDHVVRLAYTHGHATVDAVWQHPANAELRAARPDPGVLAPADVVHVPDAPARVFEGLSTRREHTLVVELPLPMLRLVLLRPGGIPYAAHPCTAELDDTHAREDWGWKPAYGWERAFDEYLVPRIRARYERS